MTSYHATVPSWAEGSLEERLELLRNMFFELSSSVTRQSSTLLLQLLEKHICEDEAEEAAVFLIKDMLRRHPNIWFQSCEEGHITASGLILDVAHKKILLMFHKKLRQWLQMGGHGESELDPAQIALREATEESGLTDLSFFPDVGYPTLVDVDAHRIPAHQQRPEHYHLDFRYLFFTASPAQIQCLATEAKELRWFSLPELADLKLAPPVLRLIGKARRLMDEEQ